jgi:hypothetical protein
MTVQMKLCYQLLIAARERLLIVCKIDCLLQKTSFLISHLPSAYNEQLTSNDASKDKTSMNQRMLEKGLYERSKNIASLRILGIPFCQK